MSHHPPAHAGTTEGGASMIDSQIASAVSALTEITRAIHDLGEVPAGHLYAVLCGHMTLDQFESAMRIICNTGLVDRHGDLLRWVGP